MCKVEKFACIGLGCFPVVALKSVFPHDIASVTVIILKISDQTITL